MSKSQVLLLKKWIADKKTPVFRVAGAFFILQFSLRNQKYRQGHLFLLEYHHCGDT